MNGLGHAILTWGTGSQQSQARLDFSHSAGHHHFDANHLIYYARQTEIIGGTGYRAGTRSWNTATLNQNLVVVNGTKQKGNGWTYWTDTPYIPGRPRAAIRQDFYTKQSQKDHDQLNHHNNLLLWEPGYQGDKEVQVVEVDALDAYRAEASRYRRLIAMVHVAGDDTYLIDFFRVRGGTQYDWTLHGGHTDYKLSVDLSTSGVTDTFGEMKLVRKRNTNQTWEGTLDYGKVKGRFLMAGRDGTSLYLGKGETSPDIKSKEAKKFQDYMVARRTARSTEAINYLVVHEAYSSKPNVVSIEELEFEGNPGTAVGLKITLNRGVVDYVVHTLDEDAPFPVHRVRGEESFLVRGRFAHVRVKNGHVEWMKLVHGAELRFRNRAMLAVGDGYSYRGDIVRVNRRENGSDENSFKTNVALPQDGALNGKTILVEWGNGWKWGYTISMVKGSTVVINGEPGFDYSGGSVKMKYFPAGTYPGPVKFSIPGTAYMDVAGNVHATRVSVAVDDIPQPPSNLRVTF